MATRNKKPTSEFVLPDTQKKSPAVSRGALFKFKRKNCLDFLHVSGLRAFRAFSHVKADAIAFS